MSFEPTVEWFIHHSFILYSRNIFKTLDTPLGTGGVELTL